ncbi:MAG TPA: hypothetical protein VEH27_09150 [Methylomirabilota bacterium]|nr:hypothetical protein [Methylomirabilota bacterium]
MTTPLAILYHEKILPGSQLVNRLQDLGYRVHTAPNAGSLAQEVAEKMPMVLVMDLESKGSDLPAVIQAIRKNPATAHVAILAYAAAKQQRTQAAAREAGATLVADEAGILNQLPQLLEQALVVE